MPAASNIEWTDMAWNPVRGCSRVSPGCERCYAERFAARFAGGAGPYAGLIKIHVKERILKREFADGSVELKKVETREPRWTGEMRFVPDALGEPLGWKRPAKVFVNSMSDLFHEKLSNEEIAAVFGVMGASPRHTFQVLTKRPERMLEWFRWIEAKPTGLETIPYAPRLLCAAEAQRALEDWKPRRWTVSNPRDGWPLPNVHIGVSVEDQKRADERIPLLLQTPAALRFLSVEPLLEAVQLKPDWLLGTFDRCPDETNDATDECRGCPGYSMPGGDYCGAIRGPKVDWVIVGGESGPGARPCNVDWIRVVVRQCRDTGTPVFVKQLGSRAVGPEIDELPFGYPGKGNDPAYWPEDLRVREFPR